MLISVQGKTTAMVFCGDFNSAPHLGVFQLMTFQMVPNDNADWSSGKLMVRLAQSRLTYIFFFIPKDLCH